MSKATSCFTQQSQVDSTVDRSTLNRETIEKIFLRLSTPDTAAASVSWQSVPQLRTPDQFQQFIRADTGACICSFQ